MEDTVDDVQYSDLYNAVKDNQLSLLRELMTRGSINFNECYESGGNILNVAIENAGVELLASLLQVEYPLQGGNVVLPQEKYELLEKPCSVDQLTPLMQSVRCGKGEIVSFLISCGVNVNAVNKSGAAAIDFASDGRIALQLLRADSLLHGLRSEVGKQKLEKLVNGSEELKEFFEKRDKLHDAIKRGGLDSAGVELIESEESRYLVNGKGETALWQAANVINVDFWAYLNAKRFKCAGESEEEEEKIAKDSYEDAFGHALQKYFFEIKGTHVMKMVAKSRVFGTKGGGTKDLGLHIKELYESLDEYEETQILLEVLQDEHDFEVVFDFDSINVKHTCTKYSGDKDWGLTDFVQKRVYVGAKEDTVNKRCNIVGTLSHELAHKALWVVFQNGGKPYKKSDSGCMKEYQSILQDILSASEFTDYDKVLERVFRYPPDVWEQELIVRVPEIIARYCQLMREEENKSDNSGSDMDGIDLLEKQVAPLLNYYRERIMPAFQEYVENIFTSNKMTVKIMSDYQKLLLDSMNESVCVRPEAQDIEKYMHNHNGLKVILVSNVQLCYSHLKMVHKKRGENVLLVDWSQYKQPKSGYLDGLSNGAFDVLVVRWDNVKEEPKFCRRTKCRDDCIGNMFGGLCSHIIVVLPKATLSLKKVPPLEYVWNDLSDLTKVGILRKKVNFVGCMSTVNDVISDVVHGEGSVEDFMRNHLVSDDISFLLSKEAINVGKITGWSLEDKLFDQSCYVKRHLSQRSILLTTSLLEKRSDDLFVVSNARLSDLQSLMISEASISIWDPLCLDNKVKCYVINQSDKVEIDTVFSEICSYHSNKRGIHLLELRGTEYLYVKSHASVKGLLEFVNYEIEEMPITEGEFLEQRITALSLETSTDSSQALTPVIIADEPGCGKSFVVNNFVSEFRNKFSSAWMTTIDLNFHAQIKSPVQLGELDSVKTLSFEELIEFLFRMVGHGNSSFERTLFKHFCRKNCKVIAIFDGFDEICPKYGDNVIGFLEALRMKSSIKICATTRLHERSKLEERMNTVAYKLVPFSDLEQVNFLGKYWNFQLKKYKGNDRLKKIDCIESGMGKWLRENFKEDDDGMRTENSHLVDTSHGSASRGAHSKRINFKKYAEKIIYNINNFVEGFKQFTQVPLHVQMVGFVIFEEDFEIGSYWDLGQLYQKFFDIKLEIFERDKVLASGNVSSEKSFGMAKKMIHELLENLSADIFFDPTLYVFGRDEMYDALSVGLTLEKEETYQFIHRTFGEFFFAKWLLREARRENVSRFWLEQLFLDKVLFRVRWFLEDILRLHYLGTKSPNCLVLSNVTHPDPSVVPEERLLVCLNACLFAIIVGGCHSLLQYFGSGFGTKLVRLLIGHKNFPSGFSSSTEETVEIILKGRFEKPIDIMPQFSIDFFPGERIYRHPKIRQSESPKRYNAFTLSYEWHVTSRTEVQRLDKTFNLVQKMLTLIEEHKMSRDLNDVFHKHGFKWILPPGKDSASFECYFSVIAKFLTGKNMELFKSSLKNAFLKEPNIWESIQRKDMMLFNLMCSVADGSLEESEFEGMFLENEDFFKLLATSVRYSSVEEVLGVWGYVEKRLSRRENRLKLFTKYYIDRSDYYNPKYVNVLTNAVLTNDLVKVTFVWELARGLMNRDTFYKWFLETMVSGQPNLSHYSSICARPPVIFRFLQTQVLGRHMEEDEVVKLLLAKNTEGSHYFLRINTRDYTFESLQLFYELLSDNLKSGAGEVLMEMQNLYWYLIDMLGEAKNWTSSDEERLPLDVVVEFGKIISSDESNLLDQLKITGDYLDAGSSCSYKTQNFMAITILTYKYLELGRHSLGSEILHKFLKSENVYESNCPNVLHHLLRCKVPISIGLTCAALLQCVSHDAMVDLLFMKNQGGNSIFHIAASDGDFHCWGKFYDVARILLKESALSEVHGIANERRKCVQDIFTGETRE